MPRMGRVGNVGKRWGFHRPVGRRPGLTSTGGVSLIGDAPAMLIQAVIELADATAEGRLVQAVALPWFELVKMMERSPATVHQVDWRKWEEIIAGAYRALEFEVVLTPRAGDKGRDVIATRPGVGSIRFFDQVKAYAPGHLVPANDVRAMLGVLSLQPNVSKGIITTTSGFAPGILQDPDVVRFLPYRLELKAKDELLRWLSAIAKSGRRIT